MTTRLTDEQIAEVREVAATGGRLGVIRRDYLDALLDEVRASRSSTSGEALRRDLLAMAERWLYNGGRPPNEVENERRKCGTELARFVRRALSPESSTGEAASPDADALVAPLFAHGSGRKLTAAETPRADLAEIERLVEEYGHARAFRVVEEHQHPNRSAVERKNEAAKLVALLTAIRSLAAPREAEEVRDAIRAALDGGCFKHPQIPQRLRAALSRLSSSPETKEPSDG